jgi:5-formyltetrahydrofolate cyclo-ligase
MEPTKEALRAQVRAARRARGRTPADAAATTEHVMDIEVIRTACAEHAVVACYVSRPEEPDTTLLRQALHAAGARVVVPAVVGTDLAWCLDDPMAEWTINEFGIPEPESPPLDVTPAVYVVPALAIDANGNRLGQGGGYYDRELAKVDGPLVIALVFEDEVVDALPVEAHDRPVDVAVTERRVRWFTMPD